MGNDISLNYALISVTLSEADKYIGEGMGDYAKIASSLNQSSGMHTEAIKEHIAKEINMLQELKSVFKELSALVKEASSEMQSLDHKYAKSHVTQ